LLRVLWLAVGAYKLDLRFDPEHDTQELGRYNLPGLVSHFKAGYIFEINNAGQWIADFDFEIFIDKNDFPIESGKEFRTNFSWKNNGVWDRPKPWSLPE